MGLGPVEWGVVVAHRPYGLEVRLEASGDVGVVDRILVDDNSFHANEEYWPDAGSGGKASDQLEYAAFYSRQLEEAALPVTRVLVDAVCKGECTYWGTVYATDALVEITCGETPPGEEHSDEDLDSRCRAVVRARLPRLYQMLEQATDDRIRSHLITIVYNVEDDTPTRRALLEKLSHRNLEGASELALQWAQDDEQERLDLPGTGRQV
ncbi:hypothetical protein [Actinomyces sp. oral taxon 897]|uniref:hypothetical protein n=1 Tax=Actinomyces sp. oral taxon 897 TaxID=2081702 RepID=UPI00101AE27D|nr:hypothetical protein [Actinomyces sp. oral taxon 897]